VGKTAAGFIGFIGGLVLGYCAVLFGWVAYTNIFDVGDLGGAKPLGIALFFAPIGGVLVGNICAGGLVRRAGRRAAG
jgi:hypothetical protein